MNAPLVSVILPTYRRGHVIGCALRSVLRQSCRDLEVLVLDDVPQDNTEAVVRAFNDPRVRYISYPGRRGVAAARNQGLSLAQGKYIAFQDSDDEWFAGKLALQVSRLESLPENFALTQAAVLRFQGGGVDTAYYVSDWPEGQESVALLRCNMTTFTQGWLARKDAILEVGGFDERLPLWEDWELLIRIAQKYRVDLDRRPVALVIDTPGGLTAQGQTRPGALQLIMDKHGALMQRYPAFLAQNLYTLGLMEVASKGNMANARRKLLQSVRLDPRKLRPWVLLIASLGGGALARFTLRLNVWARVAARPFLRWWQRKSAV